MVYCHNFTYNIIIHELRGRLSAAAFLYIKSFWLSNFDLLLIQMMHMIPIIETGGKKKKSLSISSRVFVSYI